MIKGFGLGSSVALVTVLVSAAALPQTSNVDTNRGELLVPRYGPTAVSDGTWVYVYGDARRGAGSGPDFMHDGLLSLIERVDPTSLKSEYFSNGLHRRANHGSAFADGSIVSCGGRTQVGLSRGRVSPCESLDLESGTFRELPALPESVRTLGMVAAGDDLYAVGGLTESGRYSAAGQAPQSRMQVSHGREAIFVSSVAMANGIPRCTYRSTPPHRSRPPGPTELRQRSSSDPSSARSLAGVQAVQISAPRKNPLISSQQSVPI